jgi:2-hydroxychromene-2-carboxylate isomerase
VHAVAVWLREIRDKVPGGITVEWRYFSLEQVNQRAGVGVNIWDRPAGYQSTSLDAFAGAAAGRRQQRPDAWEELHQTLLARRHTGAREPLTRAVVEQVAAETGFGMTRFRQDLNDPAILEPLARQHQEALALGVFGTPTLVFENGLSGYLKMLPAPTGEEALHAWEHVKAVIADGAYIQEIKRPPKPSTA